MLFSLAFSYTYVQAKLYNNPKGYLTIPDGVGESSSSDSGLALPRGEDVGQRRNPKVSSASPTENEPQDLSMASGAADGCGSSSVAKSALFTSPKKAFMMRNAATRETERTGADDGLV
jgi:hypothetical protein